MISGLFSLPLGPADAAEMAVRSPLRDACGQSTETFIAGPENALVRTLCSAVGCPNLPYNPIVIYGPAGVGKSSLAHALAARRREQLRLASMIVTTGADLARGLAHAIDTASASEFRSRHHRCDLLLVDDVQRLAGKHAAQQFLLTEIDALVRRGSLVIVTLRQSPHSTPGLAPALASRLAGGLVVGLAPPGPLARCELVRQAARGAGLSLAEDQISGLAGANAGPTFRLMTPARLRHAVLELAAAKEFGTANNPSTASLAEDKSAIAKSVCRHVAAAVATHFDLTTTELKSKSRQQAVAEARSLAMYIARRLTEASYAELGRHFGGRDHTTVLHACRKVARAVEHDETTRRIVDDLTTQIAAEGAT